MLAVGTQAPDLELYSSPTEQTKLRTLRGQKVILAFYPADWSPVCTDELTLFNATRQLFARHHAQLLGISVDSKWSHQAFSESRQLHFPLLADFEPKGDVARRYGVYDERAGTAQRALFVLDEQGVVRWHHHSPAGVNPGAAGILAALEKLDIPTPHSA